jgi:Short C-terminal domain
MLGGTAMAAHHAGVASTERRYAESEQDQRLEELETRPAPVPPGAGGDDFVAELTKLKGLLDGGALTQSEFDTAKQKLLAT